MSVGQSKNNNKNRKNKKKKKRQKQAQRERPSSEYMAGTKTVCRGYVCQTVNQRKEKTQTDSDGRGPKRAKSGNRIFQMTVTIGGRPSSTSLLSGRL